MNKYTIIALREIAAEIAKPSRGMSPIDADFLISPRPARLYSQMDLEELHSASWDDPLRRVVDDAIEEACKILVSAMFEDCTKEIEN